MTLLTSVQRGFLEALSQLAYSNPFTPRRIELEQQALGEDFAEASITWSKQSAWDGERPNVSKLRSRCETLAEVLRSKLAGECQAVDAELELYEDLIAYLLYYRYQADFRRLIAGADNNMQPISCWESFRHDADYFLGQTNLVRFRRFDAAHLFACFFQVARAFHEIYHHMVGTSAPAAQLRSRAWQSIFTHDMRRYRQTLYTRMADFTTLITGPSGTGKELVARAIGLSRYVPFDGRRGTFAATPQELFFPLNLSALSATLIESDLFGHSKGAYTGATGERIGWLEACPDRGTVFLDEIGDLEASIQVKLLRVLQSRTFQRIGETRDRQFVGKVIAATNQDLEARTRDGRFREDFYFRLCSDMIATPSLAEQLHDTPDDLSNLVGRCVHRVAGDDADDLTTEVTAWIDQHLGIHYPWPGNFRELEQCVRNVVIRQEYRPRLSLDPSTVDPRQQLAEEFLAGQLTAEEILRRYCTVSYAETGSYEETGRRLKLDRRTVKSKVDEPLLAALTVENATTTWMEAVSVGHGVPVQ